MELVAPKLICKEGDQLPRGDRLLSYDEFKNTKPVRVDSYLNILSEPDNVGLLKKYVQNEYKLVPIVRSNPGFSPRSNFPTRVLLEMTSRCNLICTMCPSRHLLRRKIDMEPGLFKKCVDELDKVGIDGIWIFNIGESIIHRQFAELLDYVSSKDRLGPIWLSSNGKRLNEHFARLIINSKITFMNLSVNATTPETYKRISPTADWKKMISNFRNFISLKKEQNRRMPFARVQIIDQECARGEIDDFVQSFADEADIIATNTLEAFSKDVEANIAYAEQRSRPDRKSCNRIGRQDLFIFSNGETTFCSTDINGQFSLGNVKSNSIYDVWNSDLRKQILETNRLGNLNDIELCKNCMDFDL